MIIAILFGVFAAASLGFLAVSFAVEKLIPEKPVAWTAEDDARLAVAFAKAFEKHNAERAALFTTTIR